MSLSERQVRRLMESDAYTNRNNKNYERVNREVRQGFENLYPDDDRNENPENYYVWRTQGDDRVGSKHADREKAREGNNRCSGCLPRKRRSFVVEQVKRKQARRNYKTSDRSKLASR